MLTLLRDTEGLLDLLPPHLFVLHNIQSLVHGSPSLSTVRPVSDRSKSTNRLAGDARTDITEAAYSSPAFSISFRLDESLAPADALQSGSKRKLSKANLDTTPSGSDGQESADTDISLLVSRLHQVAGGTRNENQAAVLKAKAELAEAETAFSNAAVKFEGANADLSKGPAGQVANKLNEAAYYDWINQAPSRFEEGF